MPALDTRGRARIVHDPVLTRISIGYDVDAPSVADILFPRVGTNEQSGTYYYFGRESFSVNHGGDIRAPGGQANEIPGIEVSQDNFLAREHALEQLVTEEEYQLYAGTPLRPEREAVENVTGKLVLGRELAAAELVLNPDNYIGDHVVTLTGNEQWNEHGTSDPIGDFRQAFRQFHKTLATIPNIAVIPFQVMTWLEDHPEITARYVAQGGVMTAEMIASLFGVQRVIVPGGMYNSSGNPGRPDVLSYVWGRDVWMGYVPPRPGWKIPAFGYEFNWRLRGGQWATDRRADGDRIGNIVRTRGRYDLKLTAKDEPTAAGKSIAGFLFKNAVADV